MNIINYFNPLQTGFEQATTNYHQLKSWQKAITLIASIAAGLLTFGPGSLAVFRWTVEQFSKGDDKTADAVEEAAHHIFQPDESFLSEEDDYVLEDQVNLGEWHYKTGGVPFNLSASTILEEDGTVISDARFLSDKERPFELDVKEPVSEEQEFVINFVTSFLHPYITGLISNETDLKDRKPMIGLLLEKMPELEPTRRGEIEEMALNAFFEEAAQGLYVNTKVCMNTNSGAKWIGSSEITSQSPEFAILVDALTKALPREFPNREISAQYLRKQASDSLDVVNKKREFAKLEALNYKVEGNPDLDSKVQKQREMLEQLRYSGKMFLDQTGNNRDSV
jgi:hypothetical protein